MRVIYIMIGFLINSVLLRVAGVISSEDILFPTIMLLLLIIAVIIDIIKNNKIKIIEALAKINWLWVNTECQKIERLRLTKIYAIRGPAEITEPLIMPGQLLFIIGEVVFKDNLS